MAGLLVACGPDVSLLWAPILGRPLFAWTVAAFEQTPTVDACILLVRAQDTATIEALAQTEGWRHMRILVTDDTSRRRDAVLAGLLALGGAADVVIVHDAARPLVTPGLIEEGLAAYARQGAVSAVEPLKDAIKRVRAGTVVETVPRERLVQAQSPQVFARSLLLDIHQRADPALDAPDDATLALVAGESVAFYPGGHENLRVRSADDVVVAAALLSRRLKGESAGG